jgi:hypothetical protein
VAGNLAAVANFDTFLDFDKSADPDVVANFTTVEIRKVVNADIPSQSHVGSDSLTQWLMHRIHVERFTAR